MAGNIIPDLVWEHIEPLLPQRKASQQGGRPPIGDRQVLTGIIFVLKMGIPWEELPLELGCGCGMTCLRRLRTWQKHGIWREIQTILERGLPASKRIDWKRLRGDRKSSEPVLVREARDGTIAHQNSEALIALSRATDLHSPFSPIMPFKSQGKPTAGAPVESATGTVDC